jgi:hypothetical protein
MSLQLIGAEGYGDLRISAILHFDRSLRGRKKKKKKKKCMGNVYMHVCVHLLSNKDFIRKRKTSSTQIVGSWIINLKCVIVFSPTSGMY